MTPLIVIVPFWNCECISFGGLQDMRIAWEEPFGPIIPVIRVKNIDDAIDHCNSNNLALQVCHTALLFLLT